MDNTKSVSVPTPSSTGTPIGRRLHPTSLTPGQGGRLVPGVFDTSVDSLTPVPGPVTLLTTSGSVDPEGWSTGRSVTPGPHGS